METIAYQLVASKSDLARLGDRYAHTRPDGFSAVIAQQTRLLTENYLELDGYLSRPPETGTGELAARHGAALEIALLRSIRPNFKLAASATKVAGALLFFPEDCLIVEAVENAQPITTPVERDSAVTTQMAEAYLTYALAASMKVNAFVEIVRERNPALTSPILSFEQNYDLQNWLPQEAVKHMGLIRDLGFMMSSSFEPKPVLLRDWMQATLFQKGTYHERFYLMEDKVHLSRHFRDHALAAMDAGKANIDVLAALNSALAAPQTRAQALRDPMLMNVIGVLNLAA